MFIASSAHHRFTLTTVVLRVAVATTLVVKTGSARCYRLPLAPFLAAANVALNCDLARACLLQRERAIQQYIVPVSESQYQPTTIVRGHIPFVQKLGIHWNV
jgi:hypothetical protein